MPSSLSGAAYCLLAWAAFSLQDAFVKTLVTHLPVAEALFARSFIIVALSLLFLNRPDYQALAVPAHLKAIALRSALILAAWLAYYGASRSLQLAELVTYYFVAPLFVTALSVPLLKERVSPGRWGATLLGFTGVVIAAGAHAGGPLLPVALALFAALAWALTTLLARSLARGVSTPALMMAGSVGFLVICGAMLPGVGVWPTAHEWLLLGMLGIVGGCGQYFWFEAARRAEASLMAALEYSNFLYAIFWGYLIFHDWPGVRTFLGASIVLASGLIVLSLETRTIRARGRGVEGAP